MRRELANAQFSAHTVEVNWTIHAESRRELADPLHDSAGTGTGHPGCRQLLPGVERARAFRVGSHECDKQTREPVRKHADAPELECDAQTRPLLVVELDRPARSYGFEVLDDRLAAVEDAEFSEKHVSLVPIDLDGLAGNVDSDSVEPARFHYSRPYSEFRA